MLGVWFFAHGLQRHWRFSEALGWARLVEIVPVIERVFGVLAWSMAFGVGMPRGFVWL